MKKIGFLLYILPLSLTFTLACSSENGAHPVVKKDYLERKNSEPKPSDSSPKPVPAPKPSHVPSPGGAPGLETVHYENRIQFGFMHTKQDCSVNDNGVQHKSTYCLPTDQQAMTELSGMVREINEQLDTTLNHISTAQVFIAYFSFSNSGVQRKICELSSKGVQIRVFLDGGSAGTIDRGIMANPSCLDRYGKLNVKLSYLGGKTDGGAGGIWRLHHNKFLFIDLGDGSPVRVNFSSGNLSSYGTSLHLDHWVTMVAPADSNIVRAHRCVMQGLEAADQAQQTLGPISAQEGDRIVAQSYISTRENCFDENQVQPRVNGGSTRYQIQEVLEREQIAPLFSPNNDNYVAESFIRAIRNLRNGDYLYIAIQHFLHGGVASALVDASNRGVDVRIIMEDGSLKGESEVPGVDKMIRSLQQRASGIQVRFAETNHNNGDRPAMMHNKLAILNGKMTFSGAGHYTNAALRNNWENFYFVTNRGVISSYAKYFKHLWEQSVDENYTRSHGQNKSTEAPQLAWKFLKIAE